MERREIVGQNLTGERALFQSRHLTVRDCVFEDGESPIKESEDIEVCDSEFKWKYPLWYSKNIIVENTVWDTGARAGVWYTDNLRIRNCKIDAPKNFRRCRNVSLENVKFTDAQETFWNCWDVTLSNVEARGDYFAMNCEDMEVEGLFLDGNYGFDGAKNVEIRNAKLMTKDAFWNSENVTVYDSEIVGEYLGWNAKNLTLVGCTIESLQGLCYIDNLVMKGCRLKNTTLAFEYSTVDAEIDGAIDSVLNPASGKIVCDRIGELRIEKDKVDPSKTRIVCRKDLKDKICLCPCMGRRRASA